MSIFFFFIILVVLWVFWLFFRFMDYFGHLEGFFGHLVFWEHFGHFRAPLDVFRDFNDILVILSVGI